MELPRWIVVSVKANFNYLEFVQKLEDSNSRDGYSIEDSHSIIYLDYAFHDAWV